MKKINHTIIGFKMLIVQGGHSNSKNKRKLNNKKKQRLNTEFSLRNLVLSDRVTAALLWRVMNDKQKTITVLH